MVSFLKNVFDITEFHILFKQLAENTTNSPTDLLDNFLICMHQAEKNHFLSSQSTDNQGRAAAIDEDVGNEENKDDDDDDDNDDDPTEQYIQNITNQNLNMDDLNEPNDLGDAIESGGS
eukprot:7233305-Ditylum_brightwellii.AAC.1